MTIETAQQIGWAKEATFGVDPIDAVNSDYWKFGINTNSFDFNHPIETHEWVTEYRGNHRYPHELSLVSSSATETVAFYPVNLVPYYLIMATGATHSVTSNVHTINFAEPGTTLESFTVRSEQTGGTDTTFNSLTGCKANVLTTSFNQLKHYDALSMGLSYTGLSNKAEPDGTALPALDETHTTTTKYPTTDGTMTGTEVTDRFKWDTNALLTWDYGADNVAYQDDLLNFNFQIISNLNSLGVEQQIKPEYIDEGTYQILFGMQILRGTDNSIYDDFKACTDPPDEHFLFKIYAGSTNYLQVEFKDVGLGQCRKNYAHFEGKNQSLPVWDIMGEAENIEVKGRDGLDPNAAQNKFYGESL